MSLHVSWDSDSLLVECVVDGERQLLLHIEEAGDANKKVVHVTRIGNDDANVTDRGELVVHS